MVGGRRDEKLQELPGFLSNYMIVWQLFHLMQYRASLVLKKARIYCKLHSTFDAAENDGLT